MGASLLTLALLAMAPVMTAPSTAPSTAPAASRVLVICSPGSPGTTAQAQPTLDAFAAAAEKSAGWPGGTLAAVYFESAETGIPRIKQEDASLAMVPLPFLMEHGAALGLTPKLTAIPDSGPSETWSLVAKKGAVTSPASLTGWEVTGSPGYASGFVRGPVLGTWGTLPDDARITFTPRALGALRRAATGEKVAVILDNAQTAALGSLPFAADLEIVHSSAPLPSGFLCTVANRLPTHQAGKLFTGLMRLHDTPEGKEILKTMRMTRFAVVEQEALDTVRRSLPGSAAAAK